MKVRRRFLLASAVLLATPTATLLAQPSGKVWRVGFLALRRPVSLESDIFGAFPKGMREYGYVEGRNLVIEWRFADGKRELLPRLAAELVQAKVDAIMCGGTQAIGAAQKATRTIPIVMAGANDPVGSGYVANLARPGGNITGLSLLLDEVTPKQLEMLVTIAPRPSRVAILINPANQGTATITAKVRAAAQASRVELQVVEARALQDIEGAFAKMRQGRAEAVIVFSDALYTGRVRQLAELAVKSRLPLIGTFPQYADAGALMSYGPDLAGQFREAAAYLDRIFKGAAPGELPVAQPTQFELVINLKTAKALGISIPQPTLLRADRVIE
jgi:putative ABC transport system substrate-binding protein